MGRLAFLFFESAAKMGWADFFGEFWVVGGGVLGLLVRSLAL